MPKTKYPLDYAEWRIDQTAVRPADRNDYKLTPGLRPPGCRDCDVRVVTVLDDPHSPISATLHLWHATCYVGGLFIPHWGPLAWSPLEKIYQRELIPRLERAHREGDLHCVVWEF